MSPLLSYYNTIFYVPNADGVEEQDDDGNWVITGQTTTEYRVYLKNPSKDPSPIHNPGVDSVSTYHEGYLVDPMQLELSDRLSFPLRVKCQRKVGVVWLDGEFEILPNLIAIHQVEEIIGQAIEGRLYLG
jgi:hypothetical protein